MTTIDTPVALEALSFDELNKRIADARDRYGRLRDEARTIVDKAETEQRSTLSDGEQERFDRLKRGMEKLESEGNALNDAYKARMMTSLRNGSAWVSGNPALGDKGTEAYTRFGTSHNAGMALRAIEADYASDDDRKQAATKLVEAGDDSFARYVTAVADPAYLRGWSKMFSDPVLGAQRLDRDEADALATVRAMSVGTDSAGGFGTPLAIDPTMQITAAAAAINPFAAMVRTVNITTDKWRGLTTAGATASWDGEAAEVSDDSPTLAETDITVHKLQVFVPASIEVTEDYPGFASEIAKVLSDAAMRAEHTATVSGSGTNQPWGWQTRVDGSASEIAPATAEAFAVADVYALASALPARHWPNARWAMHRGTSFDVRQFADGASEGQHAFWSDLGGDVPPQLLGKPVHISEEMDSSAAINPAATADNFVLAVADWQAAYCRVVRIGFNLEMVPHMFGANGRPTGQRGFYGYLRLGGDVVDTAAIKVLSIPTAA